MSSSARRTPTGEKSSPAIGPECPSTTTWRLSEAQKREGVMPPEASHGSISYAEASRERAKTSPSPGTGPDSTAQGPACSTSSPGSQGSLFAPEDGFSLRTYPDSFPPTAAEISPSFSRRWPNSGSMTSPGECWTHDTSECPNGGGASSSLRDVLHRGSVPEMFSLSPRAAAGILRRATKRGRTLPASLEAALTVLAERHEP